MSKIIRDRFNN